MATPVYGQVKTCTRKLYSRFPAEIFKQSIYWRLRNQKNDTSKLHTRIDYFQQPFLFEVPVFFFLLFFFQLCACPWILVVKEEKLQQCWSTFILAFANFRHFYCHLSCQVWLFFENIRLILSNAVNNLSNGVISTIGARIYAVLVGSISSRFLRLHIISVFNAYLEGEMRNCCEYCYRWLRACPNRVWWRKQVYN